MGIKIDNNVKNQKQSPALFQDILANRPPFGQTGRLFFATDTNTIYRDTGSSWVVFIENATAANFVPYTGATTNVNLGTRDLKAANFEATNQIITPVLLSGNVLDTTHQFKDAANNKILTVSQSGVMDSNFAAYFQNFYKVGSNSMLPVAVVDSVGIDRYYLNLQIGSNADGFRNRIYATLVNSSDTLFDNLFVQYTLGTSSAFIQPHLFVGQTDLYNDSSFGITIFDQINNEPCTIYQRGAFNVNADFRIQNRAGYLSFESGYDATTPNAWRASSMAIENNGNVGFGTTAPQAKVDIRGLLRVGQFTNINEPAYQKGTIYFNTTINKLRVGGATGWETVTSI